MKSTPRGRAAFTVIAPHPENPALIFIHDWGCDSRIWKHVAMQLAAFRCITYDQRGWGRTRNGNGSYSLDVLAEDVIEVARHINAKEFVIVGHGIGGRVALRFAQDKPVGLAGMVLIACAPAWPEEQGRQTAEKRYQLLLDEATLPEWFHLACGQRLGSQTRRDLLEGALGGAEGAKRSWRALETETNLQPSLAAITVPALVAGAEFDCFYDLDSQRKLAAAIPNASLQIFEGCGHLLPAEEPSNVADCIARFAATRARFDAANVPF